MDEKYNEITGRYEKRTGKEVWTPRRCVEELMLMAVSADDAAKAMNFSQAACNAANALRILTAIDAEAEPPTEPTRM